MKTLTLNTDSTLYKVLDFLGAFSDESNTICQIALNIFLTAINNILLVTFDPLSEIVTLGGYCYIITDFVDDVYDAIKEKLCVKISQK